MRKVLRKYEVPNPKPPKLTLLPQPPPPPTPPQTSYHHRIIHLDLWNKVLQLQVAQRSFHILRTSSAPQPPHPPQPAELPAPLFWPYFWVYGSCNERKISAAIYYRSVAAVAAESLSCYSLKLHLASVFRKLCRVDLLAA